MAGQLTLRRPFADHSSLHPCPPPSSTVSLSVSLLFSDSILLYFSKRTNGGTSITGSIGSSPSGNGLHPLAYRRKRKEATAKSRSGVLLLLLLNPRGRRRGRFPLLLQPLTSFSARLEKDGRSCPRQSCGRRRGERTPRRSSSTSRKCVGIKGQAPENRCGPRGFCCCSCCRCGPTTPLRQAPWGCITISSLSL